MPRRSCAALVAVGVMVLAGCSNGTSAPHASTPPHSASTTAPAGSPATTTTTTTTTTSTSTTTSLPSVTVPVIGPRTFGIAGVTVSDGSWLTVGLHPTTQPVQLQTSAAVALEVCPAGLDGSLTDTSWPTFFKFPACIPVTSGRAVLPPTNGGTHVAFAIKALSSAAPVALTLTVSYVATDTFVEVIPPSGPSTSLSLTYTPLSATTGATVSPAGLVTPAPGYTIVISQAGRLVNHIVACDFPTELPSCVGPVFPGQLTQVHVAGPGSQVVLYPTWK